MSFRSRARAGSTAAILTAFITFISPLSAQEAPQDLTAISLENLLDVKVSSVTRHLEELRGSAAAIYVLTQEDIRQSGMTDLAELLRTVPGLDVARVNSSTWAISSRGFNAQYATKLLVLVDGRTVYDPSFSGVYWHLQNLVLADVDRIEVIRGPGATMWGANAVNGVISITTKGAASTQGTLVSANIGSGHPGEGSFRFGDSVGKNMSYRLFGRQTTRSGFETGAGGEGGDSWNLTSGGFRVDWNPSKSDSFTFEGEVLRSVRGSRQDVITSLSPLTFQSAGLVGDRAGHLRADWRHAFSSESAIRLQFYLNRSRIVGYGGQSSQSVDFDFQHDFRIGKHHGITWGGGRRETNDEFTETLAFGVTPSRFDNDLSSAFVQDQIGLFQDRLQLTVGSKFERNALSGYDVQPSVRAAWVPDARHSLWVSAARAVHTASRVERGMHVNFGAFAAGTVPGVVELFGRADTRSETLMAYEAGYRYQAHRRLWTDIAVFNNVYSHLSNVEPDAPQFAADPPHVVLPLYFRNSAGGRTFGMEAAANYKVSESWTLRGSYSFLASRLRAPAGSTFPQDIAAQNPRHQGYLGSFLKLPKSLELHNHIYFVGPLPFYKVPGYTRIDSGITWRRFERLELGLNGQNLLGSHLEFGQNPSPSNKVLRSIVGTISWRF